MKASATYQTCHGRAPVRRLTGQILRSRGTSSHRGRTDPPGGGYAVRAGVVDALLRGVQVAQASATSARRAAAVTVPAVRARAPSGAAPARPQAGVTVTPVRSRTGRPSSRQRRT